MHIEDSPVERTPDLVAKIRALREQAEKQMNQFTCADDYDVRRVTGRKPRVQNTEAPAPVTPTPAPATPKRRRGKPTQQASIDFASMPAETDAVEGDEA